MKKEIKIELKEDNIKMELESEDNTSVEVEQTEKIVSYEKYNDTEVKKSIADIETEQTEQNKKIDNNIQKITELQEENKLLKEQIPNRTSKWRIYTCKR